MMNMNLELEELQRSSNKFIFIKMSYLIDLLICLLNDKQKRQKIWSKYLVYKKTFWLSSHTPRIQFNVLSRTKADIYTADKVVQQITVLSCILDLVNQF